MCTRKRSEGDRTAQHLHLSTLGICRWLRPGGAILPDRVTVHLAAASEAALDLEFWDDVYGFSMRPIRYAVPVEAWSQTPGPSRPALLHL